MVNDWEKLLNYIWNLCTYTLYTRQFMALGSKIKKKMKEKISGGWLVVHNLLSVCFPELSIG